jgi:hypothetical protein
MRPRPKNIKTPSLVVVASLILALASLLFCLCFANPSYDGSGTRIGLTYWWSFPFLFCAIGDAFVDRFLPKDYKHYSLVTYLVSVLQGGFLLFMIVKYFSVYSDGASSSYLAPRYGVAAALVAVWLIEFALKNRALKKPEESTLPLAYETWAILLLSVGELAIAGFILSANLSYYDSVTSDQVLTYFALGFAGLALLYALYLLSQKKQPIEESNLVKVGMGLFLLSSLLGIIAIFVTGLGTDIEWVKGDALRIFYYSFFGMLCYSVIALAGAGYFVYVYYRLKN